MCAWQNTYTSSATHAAQIQKDRSYLQLLNHAERRAEVLIPVKNLNIHPTREIVTVGDRKRVESLSQWFASPTNESLGYDFGVALRNEVNEHLRTAKTTRAIRCVRVRLPAPLHRSL